MKTRFNSGCAWRWLLAFLMVAGSSACTTTRHAEDQLTQVSTINALMLGQFAGVAPLSDLLRDGDIGIGTFDQLDGELIILDGEVYQGKANGSVQRPPLSVTTPFAVVTRIGDAPREPLTPAKTIAALEAELDARHPQMNSFLAVRVEGEFASLTMRSVPKQSPPFPTLTEVVKHQSVWTHDRVAGTLVGFRCPKWTGGINVPGYHWHFISNDRTLAGHIIDCTLTRGDARAAVRHEWVVRLSPSADMDRIDLHQDLSKDLDTVERQRGMR